MHKISLYNSAEINIEVIYYTCLEKYGLNYAIKIRNKIKSEIKKLSTFPESNPIYLINSRLILRKRIVNNRYIIIFKIAKNKIFIHLIYDGRRNISINNYL